MNSKNMRKKIALGTLAAMLVMGSGVASAGSHWEGFWDIIFNNRCANAGLGNGGERLVGEGENLNCSRNDGGEIGDTDPGKSRGKNKAGRPPGQIGR